MKLATVIRTFNPAEAQLMHSCLDAAGIPAFVNGELASLTMDGYSMAAGGVLLQVEEGQVAEARALLQLPELPAEPAESAAPIADPATAIPDRITVYHTFDPAGADLVRSRLEAAGFSPVLTHEAAPLYLAPVSAGGVRVEVPPDQAENARLLLASSPDDAPPY